ncbi:hypothetical protein IAR55_005714 [Kwoniella newhampshirensis]|uniref:Histone-lysine N-methyltransferase ASH1L n=1 Tax=Kwoniella newhampshirensis TaxID=1651941 RepID=A0AAW0YKQ2_9TREE
MAPIKYNKLGFKVKTVDRKSDPSTSSSRLRMRTTGNESNIGIPSVKEVRLTGMKKEVKSVRAALERGTIRTYGSHGKTVTVLSKGKGKVEVSKKGHTIGQKRILSTSITSKSKSKSGNLRMSAGIARSAISGSKKSSKDSSMKQERTRTTLVVSSVDPNMKSTLRAGSMTKPGPRTMKKKDAQATQAEQNVDSMSGQSVAPTTGPRPPKKDYMTAGFYCQNTTPSSSGTLVSKIVRLHETEQKANRLSTKFKMSEEKKELSQKRNESRATRASTKPTVTPATSTTQIQSTAQMLTAVDRPTFPPLPYDHGYDFFFGQEHEFVLPYNIRVEKENGLLDGKKKPAPFQKIRASVFPERQRISAGHTAVCKCLPETRCGDRCINRIMSYLCGKECPCGDACENKALYKRKGPGYKVVYTGARGFGIVLTEDVKEGDFVIDYRGEVISMDTFMERIQHEYKGQKNFYALEYDQDEVIDAGMRGNDARFINHGCAPNLEVRKYQSLGDGLEEYEVGMWASRDIKKGEELFYDYNFESFGVAAQSDELRTKCCCGAPNCVRFLGRKAGEKSAKEIAAELLARRAEEARTAKGKKRTNGKKAHSSATAKSSSATPSLTSSGSLSADAESSTVIRTPSVDIVTAREIELDGSSKTAKSLAQRQSNSSTCTAKTKRKSDVVTVLTKTSASKKSRQSEPAPLVPKRTTPIPRSHSGYDKAAAKKKKEEAMRVRNGAPKGWAYVIPGQEKQVTLIGSSGGRRPPRDRGSLAGGDGSQLA